jgi:hypothetical protein
MSLVQSAKRNYIGHHTAARPDSKDDGKTEREALVKRSCAKLNLSQAGRLAGAVQNRQSAFSASNKGAIATSLAKILLAEDHRDKMGSVYLIAKKAGL